MRMLISPFVEPFFCLDGGRLISGYNRDFFLTINYFPEVRQLNANVDRSGSANLEWVLDYDGQFFLLLSLGLVPKTPFQRLGLDRQKERYQILPPRPITAMEFKTRIAKVRDQSPEARVASWARRILRRFPDDHVLNRESMKCLLGE